MSYKDFLMIGREGIFFCAKQFLVKFLSRSQSCKFNLYICIRFKARKFYHPSCQINYLNRLSHIENEYLTTLSHYSCLKHKATSLGDSHKITYYIRMCNGYRTSILNLFLKPWDNRTVGSKYITKPCCNKSRPVFLILI